MPPRAKGKSKKELLVEQIAAAVGAGREVAVETVDFSDPNRPKTCLEVDFPIIPINQIAAIEGNAGKPIYQMSKWWARRRSSVFRSMLLAAAMKAPEDESKAAKAVWDVYYANHQKRGSFRHLKVAEPFMGGGTTIVEPGGHHHQRPLEFAPAHQFAHDERSLDGFAEADLITDQKPARRRGGHTVSQYHLMRE
jgi:hypothetical protein